jgi:predicted 3-demethylubiquinone-9 3-methyltransferase (glyoxalase superfamily)
MKNQIYPCLWLDGQAKEAAEWYCSIFGNSKITSENELVVTFESDTQKFMCLNGGPIFKFNPSISIFVVCESEAEIDRAWKKLLEGGAVMMPLDKYPWSEKYGWLKDKFGLTWQLSYGQLTEVSQKFTPSLMFTEEVHGEAEKAMGFYTGIFENSEIKNIMRYEEGDHDTIGTIKHAQFRLDKNIFMATDSGFAHGFTFNEAVSFVVECETQHEIDFYWEALSNGGQQSECGWLKDRFGVSWQIVPAILGILMNDPEKKDQVLQAVMKMKKFDIETLLQASA